MNCSLQVQREIICFDRQRSGSLDLRFRFRLLRRESGVA